ncbi:MAG TPA: cbb3-type cytochrome c oxidase subunit II [Candidatus Didemnitutus sp.]|nr:cbb3-type cytochrome c oxidase subunit II [Candidatus Didemnitutus sp.]
MRNGLAIFCGAFLVLAASWAGVLLTAHRQLTRLTQYKDPAEDTLFPQPLNGVADEGRAVYQDLGCASCHTQQVRREGLGGDVARKWGERQSVARDYIREKTVLIGSTRFGPDLRNVGQRIPEADYYYKLLYAPEAKVGGTPLAHGMPPFRFLFDLRPAVPGQPSADAIKLPGSAAIPAGLELVPTHRAKELVAYLIDLKDTYEYPEARAFKEDQKKEGEHAK